MRGERRRVKKKMVEGERERAEYISRERKKTVERAKRRKGKQREKSERVRDSKRERELLELLFT